MQLKGMRMYEEDSGLPAGSTGGEPLTGTPAEVFSGEEGSGASTNEETATSSTGGSGTSGAGAGTAQSASLTPEQITAAVREGVRPPEQEKEYTQEELDQIFKVWKPSEEVVTKLLAGGQDAVQALIAMRDGLSAQYGQLLKYQVEALKKELGEQYSPALKYANEVRAERDRENFFKTNEDLREHSEIVDIAYRSLLGEGKKFASLEEANKALADRARKLIPNNNGQGSGSTQSGGTRTTTTTTTKQKPAALSAGSQAGGGGGSSAPPNVFHEIFGAR